MEAARMGIAPIVDVHCHCTLERFRRAVLEEGRDWHGMTTEHGELSNPKNLWDVDRRLQEMDRLRIDVELVSPTDVFYQYEQNAEVTERIAQEANEEIAGMVRDHPARFMGLGTLPMQDPARAVDAMTRGMRELGLTGFMIDDHVRDATYDDDRFEPVWAAAEELGAFLLVHQYQPTTVTYRTEKYFLPNSIGNLVDRTITFASFIYGGVLDRHPELTVCLAHGGGYVPYALDRLDKGWEVWPEERGRSQDRPSAYVSRFLYDTVVYSERNLRFLLDVVGADRVVFGTDWPAPMTFDDPVGRLETMATLSEDEREALLRGTAANVFGGDRASDVPAPDAG
jgi:aminocarboxymuconate-semialdehyde decarboxylase